MPGSVRTTLRLLLSLNFFALTEAGFVENFLGCYEKQVEQQMIFEEHKKN